MDRRSHVVRRTEQARGGGFPQSPTLPVDAVVHGVAFVRAPDEDELDLAALRDNLAGLWRGRLEGSGERLTVAVFVQPARLPLELGRAALPLRATRPGVLASYRDSVRVRAPLFEAGQIRQLDLWWNGVSRRIALAALEAVPLGALWAMPELVIHRPSSVAGAAATGPAPAAVSHADPILSREGADPLGEINARLEPRGDRGALASLLGQLAALRPTIRGFGEGAGGGGGSIGSREPGLLQNLSGWIQWHTPLGAGLRNTYAGRQKMVDRMIASGDIDKALQFALQLGGNSLAKAMRTRFPTGLPPIRASLDFRIEPSRYTAPIFSDNAFFAVRERYVALARKLQAKGDFKRAAYIHSHLLRDIREGVLTLEAGGLFAEAARLSLAGKLDPAISVRMLFKAGELDAALALAKRTACFEPLVEDSRKAPGDYHTSSSMRGPRCWSPPASPCAPCR